MKHLLHILVFVLFTMGSMYAQSTVTGTVLSGEDNSPLIGVTVLVKGTSQGTVTDMNGKYSISVSGEEATLVFSYVGFKTQEVAVGTQSKIDITLSPDQEMLDEVVVTALGISRDKKSLGYATQEVSGDDLSAVQSDNFVNSISGKAAGVNIRRNNNMGGSTNIIIRGNTSLQGNNQALFVIDGVPVNNQNENTRSQSQSGTGYDYGNPAADINPDDIESINVLKGAAATALYGSRAANGVIMITTKKGTKRKGIGLTINSGVTISSVDKSTFPEYQKQYGAGYGPYYDGPGNHWNIGDVTGDGVDDQYVVLREDGSYGAAFDGSMVYQWDAMYPELSTYRQASPWKYAANDPLTYFETPVTYKNSIALEGASEKTTYRFSYTNLNQKGILPNSELKKHNFLVNLSSELSDKLTATASANYIRMDALGRNRTGYSGNYMGAFRQWWQTNVDLKAQKEAYRKTGKNITWNPNGPTNLAPAYWDNPYFLRHESYQNDNRDRFIGNMALTYKVTDWLNIFGRVSADTYRGFQEERLAVGSNPTRFGITGSGADGSINRQEVGSGYMRTDIGYSEYNYDLMANFDKDLNEDVNIKGIVGFNARRTTYESVKASTSGGLNIPGLYSLQNSVGPLPLAKERYEPVGVDGIYGSVSVGYKGSIFVDAALRRDHASTLPKDNSVYYYPSIATSIIFSEFIEQDWLSFGKLRVNYAEVGNAPAFDRIADSYTLETPFGSAAIAETGLTKRNADLKPERSKSIEAGLEMFFFNRRAGFDLGVYKTNSVDQALPVRVSESTGFLYKMINAGEIENRGVELALFATPIKANGFTWDINLNWTKNVNEVVSLTEGLDNLQLGSFQGGVTVNATPGEPYGTIQGKDYTYHENGQRLINESNGQYIPTSNSDNVIGNATPDWMAGLTNRLSYKNLSLSVLIDIQKGGDIFSLDMYYGLATGLYEETAFTNDLGNPVRNSLEDGGGFINEGVNADGQPNETRIRADRFGAWGYRRGLPQKAFVYDASYVKLREISISYTVPSSILEKTPLTGASLSFVGSNLWIISKDLPYADPESGLGAGNMQGYSAGSLPTTRNFGFNVKLQF